MLVTHPYVKNVHVEEARLADGTLVSNTGTIPAGASTQAPLAVRPTALVSPILETLS